MNNIKREIVAETYCKWIAQKIERTLITHFKNKERSFNETNIEEKLLINKGNRKIPLRMVGQYDKKTGEKIREFKSTRIARNYTGISEQSIKYNCLGKSKTAGGYIWKYL